MEASQKGNHMIFEQFYLECLSHASYLVGDKTTGRAVVVDPQRDIEEVEKLFLKLA